MALSRSGSRGERKLERRGGREKGARKLELRIETASSWLFSCYE